MFWFATVRDLTPGSRKIMLDGFITDYTETIVTAERDFVALFGSRAMSLFPVSVATANTPTQSGSLCLWSQTPDLSLQFQCSQLYIVSAINVFPFSSAIFGCGSVTKWPKDFRRSRCGLISRFAIRISTLVRLSLVY